MLMQCTKKLLNELKREATLPKEENPLFSWHANLIWVNRRKTAVFVNDKNRYVIVLYGLKVKDFKNFTDRIKKGIKYTFQAECINNDIIQAFINYNDFVFTKTKNNSLVSKVNYACKQINYFQELLNNNSLYQPDISKKLSKRFVSNGGSDYIHPNKKMYKDLREFFDINIFGCRAVRLKINLELEKHNVWRILIIPLNFFFTDLHKALQIIFNWNSLHLHEFYIYNDERTQNLSINHPAYHHHNFKPIVNIISPYEEIFEVDKDINLLIEGEIKLSEYLPAKMKYNYDYGDNWQHYIEVEELIDKYDKNYPICLNGKGETPPEDVGGETGYEDFLNIIRNKNHPQHSNMLTWSKSQGHEKFDIKKVNNELKKKFH